MLSITPNTVSSSTVYIQDRRCAKNNKPVTCQPRESPSTAASNPSALKCSKLQLTHDTRCCAKALPTYERVDSPLSITSRKYRVGTCEREGRRGERKEGRTDGSADESAHKWYFVAEKHFVGSESTAQGEEGETGRQAGEGGRAKGDHDAGIPKLVSCHEHETLEYLWSTVSSSPPGSPRLKPGLDL